MSKTARVYFWGVTGFEVVLILFWFGLELSMDKYQNCIKKYVGILRDLLSNFF